MENNTTNNNPKNILDPYDYKARVDVNKEKVTCKLQPEVILNGHEYASLKDAFEKILASFSGDGNQSLRSEGIEDVEHYVYRAFGIKADMKIVDSREDFAFYGFRFFPSSKSLNLIAKIITTNPEGTNKMEKIENAWRTERNWFIEMDSKFVYDLSAKFTSDDLAMLFLYRLEDSVFNLNKVKNTTVSIKANLCAIEDQAVRNMANSKTCYKLYAIPFVYILAEPNYSMFPKLNMDSVIINNNPLSRERYIKAVQKVFDRYGMSMIINRSEQEFSACINYITNWIFEGINDLKYATNRFRKNILIKIDVSNSPYLTNYLKTIYAFFSAVSDREQTSAMESYLADADKGTINKLKQLNEKGIEIYWKKKFKEITEANRLNFFKKSKTLIKPINQHEIDEIKVEISTISSADDKLYLLDKLYEIQDRLDRSFEVLAKKDTNYTIQNTPEELHKFNAELSLLRQMIISQRIRPEGYGLYIRYPEGYEG